MNVLPLSARFVVSVTISLPGRNFVSGEMPYECQLVVRFCVARLWRMWRPWPFSVRGLKRREELAAMGVKSSG